MGNSKGQNILLGDPIYTLGQSGTNDVSQYPSKPNIIVYGRGTDVSDPKKVRGKAKRKIITQRLMLALIDVLKEKGEMHRKQPYWNAYHCQSKIIHANGRTYASYCGTRYCLVCCANRKAEIIYKYLPIIQQWEAPHFVTLTMKAIKQKSLKLWFKAVKVAFRRIKDKNRKRRKRDGGPKFMGVKSLECNFNPVKRTYNPHLHLIVPNKEVAEIAIDDWIEVWNTKDFLASRKAQHMRSIGEDENILVEVIKYSAKILTDPEMKDNGKSGFLPVIYARAMDNIFCAMGRDRLFDRFGFNLPKMPPFANKQMQYLTNYDMVEFDGKAFDWLNYDTGELLTGHQSTPQLRHILNTIDTTTS